MSHITAILQEALYLCLVVSAPPIILSLVVGFLISVFQATTQIQEQTLSFAPKVIIVFGTLAITGNWMGAQLMNFTFHIFDRFPQLIKP